MADRGLGLGRERGNFYARCPVIPDKGVAMSLDMLSGFRPGAASPPPVSTFNPEERAGEAGHLQLLLRVSSDDGQADRSLTQRAIVRRNRSAGE
jgi:hypothetical protein